MFAMSFADNSASRSVSACLQLVLLVLGSRNRALSTQGRVGDLVDVKRLYPLGALFFLVSPS